LLARAERCPVTRPARRGWRRASPIPPKRPLAAPHRRSARVGEAAGRRGSASRTSRRPVACEHTTAAKTVEPRFVARPPRKSAAPYAIAAATASALLTHVLRRSYRHADRRVARGREGRARARQSPRREWTAAAAPAARGRR